LKKENKYFLKFYFFGGFLTQFSQKISKASTLCSIEVLSQEDSKFFDLDLHNVKRSFSLHFKCYNLTIYVVNYVEKIPHISIAI
jgi:hypothetical protein